MLWLVEWPERGRGATPVADLDIRLAIHGTGRSAELMAGSPAGQHWLDVLLDKPDLQPLVAN